MSKFIDKEMLIESINERLRFQLEVRNYSGAKELEDLLYVINKGCFDVKEGDNNGR